VPVAAFIGLNCLLSGVFNLLMSHGVDAALCLQDLTNIQYFLLFTPVLYWSLREDSRYWTSDEVTRLT
jgi:hypothetical protein